ncbi:MAG: NAD-binding protein [Actinomycetota bacterium]|nr:NAD-binding protein [Actinomycetota bacterium]
MPPTNAAARRARRISDRFQRAAIVSLLVLVVAPVLMWFSEHETNEAVGDFGSAYVWVARTLFEAASPIKMGTALGFVAYYIVRIAGYGLVAFATGALASRFVQTVILRGSGMGMFKRSGHLVICGWNSQGEEIVRELLAKEVEEDRPIVVLAQLATDPYLDDDRVTFIKGNPTSTDDLRRAGIDRAGCAIVVADATSTSSAADDQDARSLLTVLAIESLNPNCYTCVEVVRSENRQRAEGPPRHAAGRRLRPGRVGRGQPPIRPGAGRERRPPRHRHLAAPPALRDRPAVRGSWPGSPGCR